MSNPWNCFIYIYMCAVYYEAADIYRTRNTPRGDRECVIVENREF